MRHLTRECTNCCELIIYRANYRKAVITLLMPNASFHTCHYLHNVTTCESSLINEIDKYVPQTFTSLAQIARRLPISVLSKLSISQHESYIEKIDNNTEDNTSISCTENGNHERELRSMSTITEFSNCNTTTSSEELASTRRVLQKEKPEHVAVHKNAITYDNKDKGGLYAFLTSHQNLYEVTQIGKVTVTRKRSEREKSLLERQNAGGNAAHSSSSSSFCTVPNPSYDEVSLSTSAFTSSSIVNQQRFAPLEVYHHFTTFTIPVRAMWEQSDNNAKRVNNSESYEKVKNTAQVLISNNKNNVCISNNTSISVSKTNIVNLIIKYDKWLDYRNPFMNKANYTLKRYINYGYVRIRPRFQFSNLPESAQKELLMADNVKSKQTPTIDCNDDNEETSNNKNIDNHERNDACGNISKSIFTPDLQFAKYRVEEYEIYRLARLIPRLFVDVPLSADRMAVARNLLPPNRDPVHVFMSAPELYRVTTELPAPSSTTSKNTVLKNVKEVKSSSISGNNDNINNLNNSIVNKNNSHNNTAAAGNNNVTPGRRTRKLSIIEALTKEHKIKMPSVNSGTAVITTTINDNNSTAVITTTATTGDNSNDKYEVISISDITEKQQANSANVIKETSTNNVVTETDNTSVTTTNNDDDALNTNTTEDDDSLDECYEDSHELLYVRFLLEQRFVPHHQPSRATLQRQLDEILARSRNKQGVNFPVDRAKRRGIERRIQFMDNPSPFFHHRVMAQYIFDLLPVNADVRFSDLMRRLPLEIKLCIPPESIRILKEYPQLFFFDSTTSDQVIRRADCDYASSHAHCRSSPTVAPLSYHAWQQNIKISNDDVLMHMYNHYTSLRHPELGTNIFRYFSLMPKVMQLYLLRLHDVESELLLMCPDKVEIITDQVIVVRTQGDLAKYELKSNVVSEYQLRSCKGRRDFFVAFRFRGEWLQKLIKRFQWHCKKYGYDPFTTQIIKRSD